MAQGFTKGFLTCLLGIAVVGGTGYFSYNMGTSKAKTTTQATATVKQDVSQEELNKTTLPFEEEDLKNLNKISVDPSMKEEGRNAVFVEKNDGTEELITGDAPHYSFSPDKTKVLLLETPYEDTYQSLYTYDFVSENLSEEISPEKGKVVEDQQTTPKSAVWLDNRYILTVIGGSYGSANIGGTLWIYDTEEDKLAQEVPFEIGDKAVDFYVENGYVICQGIEYIDDNFDEYEEVSQIYYIAELLDTVQ
ncbi:DUF4652 domain-containing protein [Domibacillus tundrae]|uniref:DUF4652 domain-containing protein n=1 Tax=Domibacillus tundrae TaxID=1587527 RepID=UPI000617BC62|nr:DUF4652 domain-containing protein [Domibacillus tundrae]